MPRSGGYKLFIKISLPVNRDKPLFILIDEEMVCGGLLGFGLRQRQWEFGLSFVRHKHVHRALLKKIHYVSLVLCGH